MRVVYFIFLLSVSCFAKVPTPPMPVAPAITNAHPVSASYVKLPSLSPVHYLVFSWPPSASPNVREYEFDLFPTPTSTNAELTVITLGTCVVVDAWQYPSGFPGVTAINSQGLRSVMVR